MTAQEAARRRKVIAFWIALSLFLGAIITAFPLYWMISGSLKPSRESLDYPPTLFPHEPTLSHYAKLFTELDFGRYLVNTMAVVAIGGVGVLLMAMAGYAFAKFEFRGKGILVGRPFPPMINHLRVSVGTPEDMDKFVKGFKEIFPKKTATTMARG